MQESFIFNTENFIKTTFFSFTEGDFFKNILSFALFRGTFISLALPEDAIDDIVKELTLKKDIVKKNCKFTNERFCNLDEILTGKERDEIKLLDFIKSSISNEHTIIFLFTKNKLKPFKLYDLKTRFFASVILDFEKDTAGNFFYIARHFFLKNGIRVEEKILNLILANTERTLPAFGHLLETIKNYTLRTKQKITPKNFKFILEEYESKKY